MSDKVNDATSVRLITYLLTYQDQALSWYADRMTRGNKTEAFKHALDYFIDNHLPPPLLRPVPDRIALVNDLVSGRIAQALSGSPTVVSASTALALTEDKPAPAPVIRQRNEPQNVVTVDVANELERLSDAILKYSDSDDFILPTQHTGRKVYTEIFNYIPFYWAVNDQKIEQCCDVLGFFSDELQVMGLDEHSIFCTRIRQLRYPSLCHLSRSEFKKVCERERNIASQTRDSAETKGLTVYKYASLESIVRDNPLNNYSMETNDEEYDYDALVEKNF